jgi:hypothetical protein
MRLVHVGNLTPRLTSGDPVKNDSYVKQVKHRGPKNHNEQAHNR